MGERRGLGRASLCLESLWTGVASRWTRWGRWVRRRALAEQSAAEQEAKRERAAKARAQAAAWRRAVESDAVLEVLRFCGSGKALRPLDQTAHRAVQRLPIKLYYVPERWQYAEDRSALWLRSGDQGIYVELIAGSNGWFRYQVCSAPSLIQWSNGTTGSQTFSSSHAGLKFQAYDPATAPATKGGWTVACEGSELLIANHSNFRIRLSKAGRHAHFSHCSGRTVRADEDAPEPDARRAPPDATPQHHARPVEAA